MASGIGNFRIAVNSKRVPGCIVPKQRIVVFDLNRAEVIDRDDS